jgi:bifunctional non-homologous end joining protein LigD
MPASKPREAYRRKRDFSKTIEPSGRTERETAKPETLRFVVARSPKDLISFPATKPLAVHVEDHPPGDFEGVVPQDQYGAGSVIVWDSG